MSGESRSILTRVRTRLGVPAIDLLQARAREVDAALAENARLDGLLTPRVAELEQAAVSVAEKRLASRA